MEAVLPDSAWEAMFAPYDQATYQAVLDRLGPDDVVLDIGAGDLRLARQMACMVRVVYAVEIDPGLLDRASASRDPLPPSSRSTRMPGPWASRPISRPACC